MRRAALILAIGLVACEGKSPTEPYPYTVTPGHQSPPVKRPTPTPTPAAVRYNMVSVIGRVQDASSGRLVPASVEMRRDAAPGSALTLDSPTGEFWAVVVPATWHLRVIADGYAPTFTDLAVPDSLPQTTITIGMRRR